MTDINPLSCPAEIGAEIAARIRAELVCCNMYDRVQRAAPPSDPAWNPAREMRRYHDICHWGEAAARIAEDVAGERNAP